LITDRGGGLRSDGASTLVGNHGAGVVSNQGARFALRQAGVPVVGARVFLADSRGVALPGLPEARTDGAGRFSLVGVPPGLTYLVVVEAPTQEGPVARLVSLGMTAQSRAEVSVGLGTTLVAAAVVEADRGVGPQVGPRFQNLAVRLESRVDERTPLDLVREGGVRSLVDQLGQQDDALRAELAAVRLDLLVGAVSPEELGRRIAAALLLASPSPAPGPSQQPDARPCEALFKRVDLDGDGIVTYEESAKLDQNETDDPNVRFLKEHDADGDGKLTLAEACGGRKGPLPVPCDERFRFYAGADGVITPDEVGPLGWSKDQFIKYDANQDGRLDRAEWGWAACGEPMPVPQDDCARRFFAAAGSDGVFTTDDMALIGWTKDVYVAYDRDGNGVIDQKEFCSPPVIASPVPLSCEDRFKRQAGADGMISYDEAKLASWADAFQKADLNYDKLVGRREFGWIFCGEPMPDPTPAPTTNPCDEKFKYYAGRDGVTTIDEIAALGWTRDAFYKYDANRDGKVDRAEWGVAVCGERPTVQPVLDETLLTRTP
jgi:hypothetical protein